MAISISVQRHPADGFTLYALSDGNGNYSLEYFSQRYIGYSLAEAKRLFLADIRSHFGVTRLYS